MGAGNAGKGDSGQVSGNEAFYSKQPNSTINKGINVSTYGDRNIGEQSFVNFKPEPNKFTPVTMQVASKVLDGLTGATKKNRQFLVDNYGRIKKNYNLPDRTTFNKMSLEEKNKTYSTMRKDFMSNNKNPYGETTRDGGENSAGQKIIQKNIGGSTITTTAPTEAEVSQSEAANADAAALKVKKRGRSASIMTGSKGVTRTSTDYSLGKKSLLGQV
jgi:hypothetical protein